MANCPAIATLPIASNQSISVPVGICCTRSSNSADNRVANREK